MQSCKSAGEHSYQYQGQIGEIVLILIIILRASLESQLLPNLKNRYTMHSYRKSTVCYRKTVSCILLSFSVLSLFVSFFVIGWSSEMVASCYLINISWCLIRASLQTSHLLGLACRSQGQLCSQARSYAWKGTATFGLMFYWYCFSAFWLRPSVLLLLYWNSWYSSYRGPHITILYITCI